jgi:2,4-dienoyl-CoA reductase-like NADH-dependent reductase (Old Yellow Enzyme family)
MVPTLLDPIQLGAIAAPNRIVMAPLTRGRATAEHVPTALMVDYYRQRATAGLILTEATGISREGLGWPYAPGLWNDAQVEGWKPVVDAVHQAGGRIVAQLWHMGRIGHVSVNGVQPVSASATTAPGSANTYEGKQPYEQARPLDVNEIPRLLDDYRNAARNALKAGFDGVQIHSANGYLLDQFLRDSSNQRTDRYGGSIENRIRLLQEVTQAVIEVAGKERTSVRLSPNGEVQGVNDSNPQALFTAAARALSDLGIAFLEMRAPRLEPDATPAIRAAFDGPLILNSDYDAATGNAALVTGEADAIAFGKSFIANPDLVRRIAEQLPLNAPDASTFYTQGAEGYTDYPVAEPVAA